MSGPMEYHQFADVHSLRAKTDAVGFCFNVEPLLIVLEDVLRSLTMFGMSKFTSLRTNGALIFWCSRMRDWRTVARVASPAFMALFAALVYPADHIFQISFRLAVAALILGIARNPLCRIDQIPGLPVMIAHDTFAWLQVLLILW